MPRGRQARHLDAIHAGHDNVGQQQVPGLAEHRGGFLAIGAGRDVEAGAFQRAGQEAPQGIVVFGKQDARHVVFGSARSMTSWLAG